MRQAKAHYLRSNHADRSPHAVLFWDTETVAAGIGLDAPQVLRLWRARHVLRHGIDPRRPRSANYGGDTAQQLADLIDRLAVPRVALWCYAHNLGFDLAVTALPVLLAERGWTLTMHALATEQPWARMTKGRCHLILADSWSLLPDRLEEIGARVGVAKPQLPEVTDGPELWGARCDADVDITATAVCQVLDWWDANALGNWSLTGPGCGWSTLRHRDDFGRVVIDPDEQAIDLERRAITGGRREVWRTGKLPPGVYADLDFLHAHLSVCQHMRLPWRRGLAVQSLPLDSPWLSVQSLDVLAEVDLECAVPRYPMDTGSGIVYPTGRFRTVLAGPEIREAKARGELRAIGRGYVYDMRAHMAGWAGWVADVIDGKDEDAPPAAVMACKGWSRSVPGKWAAHVGEVVAEFPDPRPGWHLEEGAIMPGRIPARYLSIGGTQYVIAMDRNADDAFPAVLAWVQSWTRVLLSRLIDRLGDAVVQCNTDGALVDCSALIRQAQAEGWAPPDPWKDPSATLEAALARFAPDVAPLVVRVKHLAQSVEVIGPQHVILDAEKRLSGIPRRAAEDKPRVFSFEVWPRLPSQIGRGRKPGFFLEWRTVSLVAVPVAKWRLIDGVCLPPEARCGADGICTILPPPCYLYRAGLLDMDAPEHPALAGLLMRGWEIAADTG